MAKSRFTELEPKSAAAASASASAAMSLDDLDSQDARNQHLVESLETATRSDRKDESSASLPGSTTSEPAVSSTEKRPATAQLSSPIDAVLRKQVRDVRFTSNISEAFIVETALRTFFGDRSMDEIVADLRARGGRARRK